MWAIDNETPFAVARGFARDRDGGELWLVAIKATADVAADGTISLAATQEPVLHAPVPDDPAGEAGLRYEAELLPGKCTTDIVLHATAHAPRGQPTSAMVVKVQVGTVAKTLRVTGDRRWERGRFGLELSPPEQFTSMELTWRRAYGGKDPRQDAHDRRNPIGRGFAVRAEHRAGTLAPNILYPGIDDVPACFAPVARDWMPRVALAGSYDQTWQDTRKPLPPDDFDDRFLQAAPEDQQPRRHLTGGEEVALTNLTPTGQWRFHLPRLALNCTTRFGRRSVHHRPDLQSVTIEPDAGRVIMLWGTSLPCHDTLYELSGARVTLKRRQSNAA